MTTDHFIYVFCAFPGFLSPEKCCFFNEMIQEQFARRAVEILKTDNAVTGLAAAGSWISNELDEFSDLDLILVTKEKISADKTKMLAYARRLGDLLTGFTGEHVGEPRVLICLFDNPLLHVDIKFVTLKEFEDRIETPVILLDKEGQLENTLSRSTPKFPYPEYQWIEDRFWTWVHYALVKIGRGEYFEALDFFSALRSMVLGPLLHIKNGNLPKAVRKIESQVTREDLDQLLRTLPAYDKISLINALEQTISLYRDLRRSLFTKEVILQTRAEEKVMQYLDEIK